MAFALYAAISAVAEMILWQVRGATWSDQSDIVKIGTCSPILSIENVLESQNPILLADAQVQVCGVGAFFVRSYSDDLWHVLPWREQAVVKTVKGRLGKGDIFVDAGANIGFYTILASRIMAIPVECLP